MPMTDVRHPYPRIPASWPSAGIVDARSFRIGQSEAVHSLTHASPNLVRGACGVTAHVVERDGRLADWADALPDCPSCKAADGHWIETPAFPVEDWRYEVANGDTRRGYDDWCAAKAEEAADD